MRLAPAYEILTYGQLELQSFQEVTPIIHTDEIKNYNTRKTKNM
jgi:hypothetical protein